MGVIKNHVGRPSNKKRLLRKLLVGSIIIVFILLVAGIYLYVNRFPYSGYKYEDDDWDVMTFSKSGKFSLVAVDAGNDHAKCENERYFYNKRKNRINLYCGLKLVEQFKIIEINENDFVAEHINLEEQDGEEYIWHWKRGTTYYSEYSPTYESRMNKAGYEVIEKLVGKAFYYEHKYYKGNILDVTVYFKDKDTILYSFNGNTYKVSPDFSVYSGKMIDINVSFCGSFTIIYDIENDRIVYTNGKQVDSKNIHIDMNDIKDKEEYYHVCDQLFYDVYDGNEIFK